MQSPIGDLGEVFFALCKSVDTPMSLGSWLRFKYGGLHLYSEQVVNPKDYVTSDSFAVDYAVCSYLSKLKTRDKESQLRRREVALEKFSASELKCASTNRIWSDPSLQALRPGSAAVIHTATRKIAKVLGKFSWDKVLSGCAWGPGATNGVAKRQSYPDVKYTHELTVTPACVDYAIAWLSHDIHWFESITGIRPDGRYSCLPSCLKIVWENKVVTVPKSFKTDRTIAAEPSFNGFIQRGVGRYIRKRLGAFGVDLNNQGVNQTLALRAFSDSLATLDLSAASDTIAINVIKELLPLDWFLVLDRMRSQYYEDPSSGMITRYEKFSSMGNAFTFELESLIFWALSSSIDVNAMVFGDDIVVSQSDVNLVIQVLEDAGFSINLEKSFTSGAFFESCGKYYFGGFDVTPCYQKDELSDESSYIHCHNRLLRLSRRLGMEVTLDDRIFRAVKAVRRLGLFEDSPYRVPFGPDFDDGWAVLDPVDLRCVKDASLGFRCCVYSTRKRRRSPYQLGGFAHRLWAGAVETDSDLHFRKEVNLRRGHRYIHWPEFVPNYL